MENKLLNKLHGFDCAPKDRFQLLTFNIFNTNELALYEFYITITDWDPRHKTYGCINTTDKEVSDILGCDKSTITRTRNKLIKKRWLFKQQDGTLKVKDFAKWTTEYWKKVKESGAKKHRAYADLHNKSATLHKEEFDLVSYKEKVSGDIDSTSAINTEEEFERLSKVIFKL